MRSRKVAHLTRISSTSHVGHLHPPEHGLSPIELTPEPNDQNNIRNLPVPGRNIDVRMLQRP
ncbi:hypothetical protein [Paracidobacterium acidisoli]|uniref:hypothetical protein n=1 Tax=Paracidobacterium acidisoli TaxID=2303751 RepID=UPI001314B8E9|nr:hypothetical protein [Paracidobacterium acidisoli]MBT9332073.1 hypothetical protein [Paracidobacterium acidisoli]